MTVWGGLTNSCEKKRSEKQRKKERYSHLNAEFQRVARRDKKAFLSNQCKEIDENNSMWKTRNLFKIIRDTKGTFHANMATLKDRNVMDLREAEDIKKRSKNTQKKCTKKIFMTQIIRISDGMITHLEPDILECKVKWALQSITTNKTSGGDGIQLSYFKY